MPIGPARMPLMEHLGELRMRIVRIVAALLIALRVFYTATPTIIQLLLLPIAQSVGIDPTTGAAQLYILDPFEAFATRFFGVVLGISCCYVTDYFVADYSVFFCQRFARKSAVGLCLRLQQRLCFLFSELSFAIW